MRFFGITALVAGTIVLGACGGGDNRAADTTAAAAGTTTTDTALGNAAGAPAATTPAPGTSGTATMAPITGKTVEVRMIGDAQGYRFEPANITLKPGDGIRFINVSGGPHNVAFDPATVPADVKPQLNANMQRTEGDLNGPLLTQPNETFTVSFGNVKPGTYNYHCTPHLALGMKGTITVQ